MPRALIVAALMLIAGTAQAQSVMEPEIVTASQTGANLPDPGRDRPVDIGGLSSRGGPNPIGDRSFTETIGRPIYSSTGTPILTPIGVPR